MNLAIMLFVAWQAQEQMPQMPGMSPHDHAAMMAHNHGGMNEAGRFLMEQASGTSRNPQSWKMPMLAAKTGAWNWMFMGEAYIMSTQQTGPRGGDKFFSPNWFMASTEHAVGKGAVQIQLKIGRAHV